MDLHINYKSILLKVQAYFLKKLVNFKHLYRIIIYEGGFTVKKTICILLALIISIVTQLNVWATISTEYMSEDLTADSGGVLSAAAEVESDTLELAGKSAVLMERDTGKVLYSVNPDEKCAPASITKIMSLLLIMEAIDNGKLTLKSKVSASEHACSMGGSQIWLEPGETMTVDELLKATVIASANDATVALGEAVSGSEEAFVNAMNKKARELGMSNTRFVNCSGLDAEGHYSTARDIAIMSCALLKHDMIKNYTTVWMDGLRGGESQLVNTNKLVRFYEGATGLKTGTTSKAGFCVSASAEKQGMELCAVVLGAANNDERFGTAKKLLNYGFANWGLHTVTVKKKDIPTLKVEKGCEKTATAVPAGRGKYLIENGAEGELKTEINLPETIEAPVAKGQKLGTAKVLFGDKQIGEIDLISTKAVERMTFTIAFGRIFSALIKQ